MHMNLILVETQIMNPIGHYSSYIHQNTERQNYILLCNNHTHTLESTLQLKHIHYVLEGELLNWNYLIHIPLFR